MRRRPFQAGVIPWIARRAFRAAASRFRSF